jgi:undecaprenyl-diphosphatase
VYSLRLVLGVGITVLAVVSVVVLDHALVGLRADLDSLHAAWPEAIFVVADIAFGVAVAATIVGVNAGLLLARQWRRWLTINLAAFTAIALTVLFGELILSLATSDVLRDALVAPGAAEGSAPGSEGVASMIAVYAVAGPWIGPRLRPWARGLLVAAGLLTLLGTGAVTLHLDVGVGVLAGSLVALAVKTPSLSPTSDEVADALARSGLEVSDIEPAAVDARGSVPWFVTTREGASLFVKTLSAENRSADLLFRLYRFVRLRRAGDHKPFASLRRAVEHEALLSLAASARGIRTPRLVATAEVGTTGMLLAYDRVRGRTLADDEVEVSDDRLRLVWAAVGDLHRQGIAHRDLRLANLLIDDRGEVWLIDFGFAELAAPPDLLDRDVAELLASTSTRVGPQRAVDAAVATIGGEHVAAAAPWIQPLAMSSATRSKLGRSKQFEQLREIAAAAVLDGRPVEYRRLERVTASGIVTLISLGLAVGFLAPQLAQASGMLDAIRDARPTWLMVALLGSLLTYVGAALGMIGAVAPRLALRPTILAQIASSFSNRVTPAKVGGLATNVRYLQRQGITATSAVSAVGLNTVAGIVGHISLVVAAGLAAGQTTATNLPLPSTSTAVWIVGGLILASGLVMALPVGRRLVLTNLYPAVRSALGSVAQVARTPSKLTALFGGSLLVTASYILAMVASLHAFGDTTALAPVVLVYLTASAVATAAPTPGGIGATEAALIAGYTALGIPATTAVAAVFLFRLVTFWLPILPGWFALTRLQHTGRL